MQNGVWVLQLVLHFSQAKAPIPLEMIMRTVFEAQLYFHEVRLVCVEATRKKLIIIQNAENSTLAAMTAQLAQKVWDMATISSPLTPLLFVI